MNQSIQTSTSERPSRLRIFSKGFLDGAFNGAIMMGIFSAITMLVSGIAAFSLTAIFIGMATTSLFGGIMSVTQASRGDSNPQTSSIQSVAIPVAMTPTVAPALASTVMPDAPEQASTKSWVAHTGQPTDTNRIQSIIDNGAMSDKNRASAILAARDAAAADNSVSRI